MLLLFSLLTLFLRIHSQSIICLYGFQFRKKRCKLLEPFSICCSVLVTDNSTPNLTAIFEPSRHTKNCEISPCNTLKQLVKKKHILKRKQKFFTAVLWNIFHFIKYWNFYFKRVLIFKKKILKLQIYIWHIWN